MVSSGACHGGFVQVLADLAKDVAEGRELIVDRGLVDARPVRPVRVLLRLLRRHVVHHVGIRVQFRVILDKGAFLQRS